ncbi:MAG: ABC transporter permease, partial [Thermodesulfovibrionales bacterium]|nr:ABC transporter permease [Thermodesulfovibrionales bacterium]
VRGTSAFLENGNLIKKVKFPMEICIVSTVLSSTVSFIIYLFIYLLVLTYEGIFNYQTAMFIFLPFVIQLLLIYGISLGLGSIAVFFRDITQVIGMILNFFFFLTPIVYPASVIPENVRWLYHINPFYFLVEIYRNLLVKGIFPEPALFIYPTIFSLIIFMVGYFIFFKTKKAFVDIL